MSGPGDQVCELWTGRKVCGRPAIARFLFGWRCAAHAPTMPTPTPAYTIAGRLAGPPLERDPIAYGTATTDPLGRDAPAWKLSTQSRLPIPDKGFEP